jgi:hypothetical protein
MICMSITSTYKAITRNTKEAAETRQNEDAERARNFKEAQSQYPAKTLIEITSSKELLRTAERDNLFNGPPLATEDLPLRSTHGYYPSMENKIGENATMRKSTNRPIRNARHSKIHTMGKHQIYNAPA